MLRAEKILSVIRYLTLSNLESHSFRECEEMKESLEVYKKAMIGIENRSHQDRFKVCSGP